MHNMLDAGGQVTQGCFQECRVKRNVVKRLQWEPAEHKHQRLFRESPSILDGGQRFARVVESWMVAKRNQIIQTKLVIRLTVAVINKKVLNDPEQAFYLYISIKF